MIVKNIITLDTKKGLIPELSFVEGISDNIISIKVFNIGTNPKIEIYYGCDFKELTGMDGNEFIIPSEYCSDNEIIHLRYIDDKSKSNFIHIVGNESAYENLKLTKKSNFLFCCDGKRKKSSNSTSDITIDDYLDILSKNPVTNEAISSAIVEIQNVINEEKENLANLSSDVESLQAKVQENKTGTDKAISGLNASMSTMGQHLSTLGNDFDTFKSSTTEGMSNLSNRVGVVESKVGKFGTAAKKNYTTTVASGNTNLPTSGAVFSAISKIANLETGRWTPTVHNGVTKLTPGMSSGVYYKIGKLVYIRGYVGLLEPSPCYSITEIPIAIKASTDIPMDNLLSVSISKNDSNVLNVGQANNIEIKNKGYNASDKSTQWIIEGWYVTD